MDAVPSTATIENVESPKSSPALIANDSAVAVEPVKTSTKTSSHQPFLDVPLYNSFRTSSDTTSDITLYSADNENERTAGNHPSGYSATPSQTALNRKLREFWSTNKGLLLVIMAQLFGVTMSVTTRLLEMDSVYGPGMHPLQVRLPDPSYLHATNPAYGL